MGLQPSSLHPNFEKNSKAYKRRLHIPFSTFPHLQLKGSKANLALKLSSASFPPALGEVPAASPGVLGRCGNGSAEELCRHVLPSGRPHRSSKCKCGSGRTMSLGHSHTCTLRNDRFPRPTLPTPCLTKVPSPGKERRRASSWHPTPLGPHPQRSPRAENVPRADVQVKPFLVSSAPVISSHGPDPGPPPHTPSSLAEQASLLFSMLTLP